MPYFETEGVLVASPLHLIPPPHPSTSPSISLVHLHCAGGCRYARNRPHPGPPCGSLPFRDPRLRRPHSPHLPSPPQPPDPLPIRALPHVGFVSPLTISLVHLHCAGGCRYAHNRPHPGLPCGSLPFRGPERFVAFISQSLVEQRLQKRQVGGK